MKLKHLFRASVILTALLFFTSCSTMKRATWHLERATKLNPGLITEHVDTMYLPELEIDTFFSVDTVSIPADIDSILNALSDSCRKEAEIIIKEPLVEYIKEREIIKDTLYYIDEIHNDSLSLKLLAQVWQDGTAIHLKILLTDAIIKQVDSDVVLTPKKKDYITPVVIAILVAIVLLSLLKRIKKWLSL